MRIVELEPGDIRLTSDALPVLLELRPHLTAESLASVYAEGYPQGLRFTAVYAEDDCVGVAGWRIVATTWCIRKLYVDDLVTRPTSQSTGVGAFLLAHLETRAKSADCSLLDLDSGTHRVRAHRFYFRERLHIFGFHFIKELETDNPAN